LDAFYGNFEPKEAILLELLSRHMAAEAEQLSLIIEADRTVGEIMDSLDGWLERMIADADWALLAMELQFQVGRSASCARASQAPRAPPRPPGGLLTGCSLYPERRFRLPHATWRLC
jgi:hypothetical protein